MAKVLTTKWSEGNKVEASDHEPNLRSINMVWTRRFEDGPIDFDYEVMDFLAYAEETSNTGYHHYQGFVCWKSQRWTYACKKKYGCYFAKMKGSLIQNDDYCSKQNKLTTFGTLPKQGARTDLKQIATDILEKKTNIIEILKNDPMIYHQYGRTLEKVQSLVYKKRTIKPIVHWYWGNGGTGKTRCAVSINPDIYIKQSSHKWWDNYTQQHTIIIDDFRKDNMPFDQLLRLLDYLPFDAEIKGGFVQIDSPYIIITCDEAPHHYWQGNDLTQIKRRIDECWHFTDSGKLRQW